MLIQQKKILDKQLQMGCKEMGTELEILKLQRDDISQLIYKKFPINKYNHPDLPIFNSGSVVKPNGRKLENIILAESTQTISKYSYNYDCCYVRYKCIDLIQFNSPVDFSTFWEFCVGIYFYELKLDKRKRVVIIKVIKDDRKERSIFKDYLREKYEKYLCELEGQTRFNLYEVMWNCMSINGDGKHYDDTLCNKRFRMIVRKYIKIASKDKSCFIYGKGNFKHYII